MPVTYSHSRLSLFDDCRLRYRLKYVDRVRRDLEGVEAFLGVRVHESLEYLYRDVLMGRLPGADDVVAGFHRRWDEEWHGEIVVTDERYGAADYRAVGEDCLRRYHARHTPFRADQTLGVEVKIAVDLPGGARLEGYADRVARDPDGHLVVHDYKTSSTLPTQAEADQDRQLALYQAGVERLWPGAPGVRLVWHYLRFDERIVSSRGPEQMAALLRETAARVARVEAETRWAPRVSDRCRWCPYWDLCPEMRHRWALTHAEPVQPSLLPAEAPGAEDAGRSAARALAADRELRGALDRVREYARATGATLITAPGGAVRIEPAGEEVLPGPGQPGHERLRAAVVAAGLWERFAALDVDRVLEALRAGDLPGDLAVVAESLVRRDESRSARLLPDGADSAASPEPRDP